MLLSSHIRDLGRAEHVAVLGSSTRWDREEFEFSRPHQSMSRWHIIGCMIVTVA